MTFSNDGEPQNRHDGPPTINTWLDAEYFAAGHMRILGFSDAAVTSVGADGGIDITATGGAGQVKHYASGPIGSPAIQQLLGATSRMGIGVFYSLSGYTKAARALAEAHDVALYKYSVFGEVEAESSRARALLVNGFAPWDNSFNSPLRSELVAAVQLYAQRVVDAGERVAGAAEGRLEPLLAELGAAGKETEAASLLATTQHELNNLFELFTEFQGTSMRNPVTVISEMLRAEAWIRQLAERLEVDYLEIAAAVHRDRT